MTAPFVFRSLALESVSDVKPECDPDGSIRRYYPHLEFENGKCLKLLKGGEGPFCRFSISTQWLDKAGVYLFVVNGQPVYIGECKSLTKRINQGYGKISPRNCFAGGQCTNIRINRLVLEAPRQGDRIRLAFHQTQKRKTIESQMIQGLSPPWNRKITHRIDKGEASEGRMSQIQPEAGTQMITAGLKSRTVIGLTEAADVLKTLGLCKAFNPKGGINSTNCYRFGCKDPSTKRWSWDVANLVRSAKYKSSASTEDIESVCRRYGLSIASLEPVPTEKPKRIGATGPGTSRAELEKRFRDTVVNLERVMRSQLPLKERNERHTLGKLIGELEALQVLTRADGAEASFVNSVRNSLNHPDLGYISDGQLMRATASASALVDMLQGR